MMEQQQQQQQQQHDGERRARGRMLVSEAAGVQRLCLGTLGRRMGCASRACGAARGALSLEGMIERLLCEALWHTPMALVAAVGHWVSGIMEALPPPGSSPSMHHRQHGDAAPPCQEARLAFLLRDVMTLGADFTLRLYPGRHDRALYMHVYGVHVVPYMGIPCEDVLTPESLACVHAMATAAAGHGAPLFKTACHEPRGALVVGAFGHNRTVARVVCTERFRVSAAWAIASAYCALRVCTELSSHPHPHSPLLWPPASCASPAASIATALRDARALLEAEGNAGGASALRSVAEEFVLSTLSK